ncbi:MAG: GMC family oxidoreductase [Spirochaetes bacterium]|nr:GMC family oxidoreductase [Spirochaetota bacterium]
MQKQSYDYDYIIIGSGFGGSVSALRLSEKGYKVLVIEKGKKLTGEDFPKRNWNLKRWLWMPLFRFFGLFKITFFRHITVLSGTGVGGGSLVYANTLPVPKKEFFEAESWSHLADWQSELKNFYKTGLKMLGAEQNPQLETGDKALLKVAEDIGRKDHFETTNVAVYFGEPDVIVPDPYFKGKGPTRTGCIFCGGCMLGCKYNAKNTLDKNYLYLAQQAGAAIQPESGIYDVIPLDSSTGSQGYKVRWKSSTSIFSKKGDYTCRGIIFSGGVLGTIRLMLDLKQSSLPELSENIGTCIRTNSENLLGVTTFDKNTVFSDGIAIGSILHTGDNSHIEPVRYSAGSGFWRLMMAPVAPGRNMFIRILKIIAVTIKHPIKNFKIIFVRDWAKKTQILLFMQSINSHLRFSRRLFGLKSSVEKGEKPTAFIPEAVSLAKKFAGIVNGQPITLLTETLFGIPTTAHILGGAVMGENRKEGVIDKSGKVFGYENMFVCDGSMISANPGVNPALTILALSEYVMSKIPEKKKSSFK